jgi:hypothetical protein
LAQDRTLQLLHKFGRPVKVSEVERAYVSEGLTDPGTERHGWVNRDLKNLVKWNLARQLPDKRYVAVD